MRNVTNAKVILKAVNSLVDFVKPTYGAVGNKIILSRDNQAIVVDDGVTIAKEYAGGTPEENAVLSIIKEVSQKTNDSVGDGTTGALIILQAIMQEVFLRNGVIFLKNIGEVLGWTRKIDGRKIAEELMRGLEEAKKELRKNTTEVKTREDLQKVARISFNNKTVADMISSIAIAVGKEGIISVEEHSGREVFYEIVDGLELQSGWLSPYFVSDQKRMEVELETPYLLITDAILTNGKDIEVVLNKVAASGNRSLLIICEKLDGDALATSVVNKIRGGFKICAVAIEKNERRNELLEDIALISGGELLTNDKAIDWASFPISFLGKVKKVIAGKNRTVIMGANGSKERIEEAIDQLRSRAKKEKVPYYKELIEKRIARFQNGIARIMVGATTDSEKKALKYKIEDAINATKAAYRGGVVCGAGISLAALKTSSPILNAALKAPLKQLRKNTGFTSYLLPGQAFDATTGNVGNYLDLGIVDPVEVLIAGIECAVSIASILCSVKGIICEEGKKSVN